MKFSIQTCLLALTYDPVRLCVATSAAVALFSWGISSRFLCSGFSPYSMMGDLHVYCKNFDLATDCCGSLVVWKCHTVVCFPIWTGNLKFHQKSNSSISLVY